MNPYSSKIELSMQRLYSRLSEKDKRSYAAVEVMKLGHGGMEYISSILSIDTKTIKQGLLDLNNLEDPLEKRTRKKEVGEKAQLSDILP